jgi:hypothetical protein
MTNFQHFPKAVRHENGDVKIAQNASEEKAWSAKGYKPPGESNPEAFLQINDHVEPDNVPQKYPMFVNGKVVQDPDQPPPKPAGMYPMMRDGKIIATEEDDMEALMEADEEMRIPAAQRAEERDQLVERATELGLRFDGRWGLARLREVVAGGERAAESA